MLIWLVLYTGIFHIIMALVIHTKNLRSAIIFKVKPFLLGVGCLIYALKQFGVI